VLTAADVARELGFLPLRAPAAPAHLAAWALSKLPLLPSSAQWIEAGSHPAVMDTRKAREQLGWTPRYTGLEALRDTLEPGPSAT
jgi:nucleoside-diphosphate-sugar epimerase